MISKCVAVSLIMFHPLIHIFLLFNVWNASQELGRFALVASNLEHLVGVALQGCMVTDTKDLRSAEARFDSRSSPFLVVFVHRRVDFVQEVERSAFE